MAIAQRNTEQIEMTDSHYRPMTAVVQDASNMHPSQGIRKITLAYARRMGRQEPLQILLGRLHEVQPCFQSVLEQDCPSHCATSCKPSSVELEICLSELWVCLCTG